MLKVTALLCLVVAVSANKPPQISIPQGNSWKEPTVYIRFGDTSKHECSAKLEGNGPFTYNWQFNGSNIQQNTKTVTFDATTGDLVIGKWFGVLHSGDYQCIVSNDYGTSMTPYLTLLATRSDAFPGAEDSFPENKEEFATNYLELICKDVPISVPPWTFSWNKGIIGIDGSLEATAVDLGDRMVIDPEGNLHFLWLELADNNYIYSCNGYNKVVLITVKNTHTLKLSVKAVIKEKDRAPDLKYKKDVEVRAGDDAVLTCIFTYYSKTGEKLKIDWKFNNQVVGHGTSLTLPKVKVPSASQNQEGVYVCEAKLGQIDPVQGKVNLKIVAPPEFLPNMAPQSRAFPVEKNAVFHCAATSHNAYMRPPVWLVNAKPLIGCPPRMFECKEARKADGYSQCIPEKKHCDNNPDCTDDSDEANCGVSCGEGFQSCGQTCISATETCVLPSCDYPGFRCLDGSHCLTRQQRCNGMKECGDNSDEIGCANGNRIEVNRFNLNSQRTELVLPSVTMQDSMCFQCIVGNDYGTVFGDGCLQVIDKIVVTMKPNSTYNTEPGQVINVVVDAVTDVEYQQQMSYTWYWYRPVKDQQTGQTNLVKEIVPTSGEYATYFKKSMSSKNLTMMIPDVKPEEVDTTNYDYYQLLTDTRMYAINISHRYDEVFLNFTVVGKAIEKPVVKPVVTTASFNLWFIALILAILILFIVVALIVCFMYRNRGGTYLLDKKEHQAGHDPEKELKDSGFHDVGRVGDDDFDNPDAEKASLSESVKPYESDEDITEEYGGDFDVSKFNEDGSFIGLYGDKKSKYSSESKEATV